MVGEGYVGLWVGEGREMEGPGRLREKASTPVLMSFIRLSGGLTSATALRQPLTSEGM